MVNKEILINEYEIAHRDHIHIEHTVLNGFSVIENCNVCEEKRLENYFRSEFMSIFLVTEGKGQISLNMEDIEIKENSLIHIAPNTLVGRLSQNRSCSISGVRFTTDFIKEIGMPERTADIFSYFSSKFFPVWDLSPEDTAIVKKQIHSLVGHTKKFANHAFGREILVHGFYIFLFEIGALGQKYSKVTRLHFSRQENLVLKFNNLAQQQFREIRAVKKYAEQLNVSAKYLTEVIKEYSGKKASDMIHDLVIMEAKFLLSKSQLSIGEIADKLCFSDQSFFGKYFKRHTGISPKAFRGSEYQRV